MHSHSGNSCELHCASLCCVMVRAWLHSLFEHTDYEINEPLKQHVVQSCLD